MSGQWLRGIWNLLMPRICLGCGARLQRQEHYLCMSCLSRCPEDIHTPARMEPLEYRLRETLPLVHVRSLYRYGADPAARRLVFLLKYHGSPEAGVWMGRQLAEHLRDTDFFRDVDCLLPVPLHPKRQRHRGYNQAECIARGVAEVTGLPVCTDAVRRVVNTHTQTRLDPLHRRKNMAHVFQPAHAAPLAGKHVVIVDDVLTTGSTVTACAQALGGVPGLRVSILTFAYAAHRV